MEKSSKRGKIPQHDWPSVIKRYEAGETLASIARTYDCSPPAISYIVSRNRARESAADSVAPDAAISSAPQLAKEGANEKGTADESGGGPEVYETRTENMAADISIPVSPLWTDPQPAEPDHSAEDLDRQQHPLMHGAAERGQLDIFSDRNSPPSPASGEAGRGAPRRTLHLSLSQEPHRPEGQGEHSPDGPEPSSYGKAPGTRSAGNQQQGPLQSSHASSTHHAFSINGGSPPITTVPHRARDADVFIDQALRERVDGDITAFLAAFDAALAEDTPESRAGLRDATDRLLRAGARTRIQLERLEARVPLPPRDGPAGSAWRAR
jgi:hypothetical protein